MSRIHDKSKSNPFFWYLRLSLETAPRSPPHTLMPDNADFLGGGRKMDDRRGLLHGSYQSKQSSPNGMR